MTPRATYRLQFREGMDFDRAAALAPYLARLGVSHLYASPIFQAMPRSTHGYDVTDHRRLDDALGGMEGFLRLSAALKAHGLGLILDIVPNHMAASPHNPWWRDVLRHGATSRYARHFDVDWDAPKLLLTALGQPYGRALDAGEFTLGLAADGPVWRYYEHAFPLCPETWAPLLSGLDIPNGRLSIWGQGAGNEARLTARLAEFARDRAAMHALHEAQPWRLVYWRAARDMLTHRRFFEITDLVGVRVEDQDVFDDVHALLFDLLAEGHVEGLRVDHVDGLADPGGYLQRLKEKAPGSPPIWVEKILGADEALPADWPIAGTTGYEFARAVAGVLTSRDGARALAEAYARFRGEAPDTPAMLHEAKHEILTRNLAAELELLTGLARRALADDASTRDWGPDSLRRGVIALASALPVYRTYLGGHVSAAGEDVLARAEAEAAGTPTLDDPEPVHLLADLLREGRGEAAATFRRRFQQTTGALMAKAVEDTLFYRLNPLLSANEVGSEPGAPSLAPDGFHAEMAERVRRQPAGLSATATHDTKRGEDARMRIAALADASEAWAEAVDQLDQLAGEHTPEPDMRWLYYQALLGAWQPEDAALPDRMAAYLVKAAREAKRRTSWVRPDEAYEARLQDFARETLGDGRFRAAFDAAATPFIKAGERKALAQLALKLTAPGVPDIYQGAERADLSLVDPDNRRPVDFALRERALDEPSADSFEGLKSALLRFSLSLRSADPALFAEGEYAPVSAGTGCLAFSRTRGGRRLFTAVARPGRLAGAAVLVGRSANGRLVACWPQGGAAVGAAGLDLTGGLDATGAAIALVEAPPR